MIKLNNDKKPPRDTDTKQLKKNKTVKYGVVSILLLFQAALIVIVFMDIPSIFKETENTKSNTPLIIGNKGIAIGTDKANNTPDASNKTKQTLEDEQTDYLRKAHTQAVLKEEVLVLKDDAFVSSETLPYTTVLEYIVDAKNMPDSAERDNLVMIIKDAMADDVISNAEFANIQLEYKQLKESIAMKELSLL